MKKYMLWPTSDKRGSANYHVLALLANKQRTFLGLFGFAAAKVIQLDVALAGYNAL